MRSLICLVITGVFVGMAPVHAGQGRSGGNFKIASSATKPVSDVEIVVRASATNVAFSPREIEVIRAHYGTQGSLPPGTQKKLTRGEQLPFGWQWKMEPFPAGLDRVLTPLPGNFRRGVIGGHAVIYDPLSQAVYDTLRLS
jgi:hypothetical protein